MRATISLFILALYLPGTAAAERLSLSGLSQQILQLSAQLESAQNAIDDLRNELASTRAELDAVKSNDSLALDGIVGVETRAGDVPTVVLRGVNLQLVNGLGATATRNGSGNLILGYNESQALFVDRNGSHNLVVGDEQAYPDTAAVVTGNLGSTRDLVVIAATDLDTVVGGSHTRSVQFDDTTIVGRHRGETVGGNRTGSIGAAHALTVGGAQTVSVGANQTISIGNNKTETVGSDSTVNVGKRLVVDAGDEIVVDTGSASVVMKKDGTILISGKDITIQGSGQIDVKAGGDIVFKGSRILQN